MPPMPQLVSVPSAADDWTSISLVIGFELVHDVQLLEDLLTNLAMIVLVRFGRVWHMEKYA